MCNFFSGESNLDGCSLDSERRNCEFDMLAASWGSTSTRLYGVRVEHNLEHSHGLLGGLGERDHGIVVAFEINFAERVGLHYFSELLRREFGSTHLSETTQK